MASLQLIIDNADNSEIDYSEYIPSSRRGHILTTRLAERSTHQTVGSETLYVLEPEFAKELLLRATQITENRSLEKAEAALAVIQTLGSHTLAIIQAGAFIRQNMCTLEEYPTVFQQRKQELLTFHSKQMMSN